MMYGAAAPSTNLANVRHHRGVQNRAKHAEAHFLNVDLDVHSRRSLEPLIDALGDSVVVMHYGKEGRRYAAHLELSASGYGQSADRLVGSFAALIENLSSDAKSAWQSATRRVFDIGIQSGVTPPILQLRLGPATLAAIAAIGGEVAITVYAPVSPDA